MNEKNNTHSMNIFRGEAISPGVAMGKIHVFQDLMGTVGIPVSIRPQDIEKETGRLLSAVEASSREIGQIAEKVHREMGVAESGIFQTHLLILNDQQFVGEMLRVIETELLGAETAVRKIVSKWEKTFAASSSSQLQMKVFDVLDIGKRILEKLSFIAERGHGVAADGRLAWGADVVLATRVLLPSITAFIDKNQVLGLVAELGNKASHSAVIAKSLGLPAVFGISDFVKNVHGGEEVIIDGSSGIVYVNPDPHVKKEYEAFKRKFFIYKQQLDSLTDLPAVTLDGREIGLYANVGAYADAEAAVKYGAQGIGLYRTEMPFIIRNEFPDEASQYAIYKKVFERMGGKPVNIRTLDLGGDKMLSFLPMPKEENPNLGWRAIRVFIDNPEFFKVQLRAILRAAVGADARIILPMISDLEEVCITKEILAEARRELAEQGTPYNHDVKLGIMIEVPSAVMLAEHLIEEVDFFSVGTNDLIQYTLAVDRNSEKAARFFEPLNPAVIYMLEKLARVAAGAGKDITVCGEVASDPLYIPILVGLGYRKLSVSPLAINAVKDIIRSITYSDVVELTRAVTGCKTAKTVRELAEKYMANLQTHIDHSKPALGPLI